MLSTSGADADYSQVVNIANLCQKLGRVMLSTSGADAGNSQVVNIAILCQKLKELC